MVLAASVILWSLVGATQKPQPEYPGQLYAINDGKPVLMPLERTSVNASIAGMGARVTVRQTFTNPSQEPIEAVYKFPLPHDSAVDQMRIQIGTRVIEGNILKKEQARQVYEQAKREGKVAALLDQETENIFTQSVANIMPGKKITVEISYVQLLKFDDGEFEFHFPMVVAPRFLGAGTPDPGAISPPRMPVGVRSGQNIDLSVVIHGGAPIQRFQSILHGIDAKRMDPETIKVSLAKKDEIPNRDFILRYRTASKEIQESLLTTWDNERGGYFALVLAPPPKPTVEQRAPKQMVFVIDQSGSQSGFPIEKSKELSLQLLNTMGPNDQFNVMGFANQVNPLWPGPRPNTPENQKLARDFIKTLQAVGGTELERAIVASLSTPNDPSRVRIVVFNTDGLAGQENVILKNIQQFRGMSRIFTFGIGNSVNRSLIDAMSYEGRGAADIVTTEEDAKPAVARFAQRMDFPVLVDVRAKFDSASVEQVTPKQLPDVFSTKPVVIYGRYRAAGKTKVTLTGVAAGQPWSRTVELDLPMGEGDGSSVASLWARARIAELTSQSYSGQVLGEPVDTKAKITEIALEHRLMSAYTSFVAVDKSVSNGNGSTRRVDVPVEAADKVGAQGSMPAIMGSPAAPATGGGFGGGTGGGGRGAVGGAGGSFGSVASGGSSLGLAKQRSRPGGFPGSVAVDFVSYDPADNSLVVGRDAKPRERSAKTRVVGVDAGLLDRKGSFDIRVTGTINAKTLAALKKAGFKVESHDGSQQVFGSATAAIVKEISKIEGIAYIAAF